MFFIQLAVFFCIKFINTEKKAYNILVGVAIGFAILTKWLPALIVLPIWFILVYDSDKFSKQQIFRQLALLVFALVVVALPWQIYSAKAFPLETAWEQYYNNLHLTEALEGRSEDRWFFLARLRISYGDLIYLPLIWFTIQTLKRKFLNKQYALLIWVFIPVIFFTIAETKMQGYILFTAPALFIITGLFYDKINELKFSGIKRVFAIIILALLILLPFRYCVERTKMLNPNTTSTEWVKDLKKLGETNHGKAILFNYPRPIEAMFYTDFIVYNTIPDIESLREFKN
ncbi:MAG: phospholipid carrier-dependent glycosyltransferase [Bacteroidetes bacterium]|nr:phospholipid carrier-dependent glycosyltransferase [Bacteroidota bacterium]